MNKSGFRKVLDNCLVKKEWITAELDLDGLINCWKDGSKPGLRDCLG
jgi:hypothetical protein